MVAVKDDTKKLLEECTKGIKTAVKSIDEVLDEVEDEDMKKLLVKNKEEHDREKSKIKKLVTQYDIEDKELSAMAKAMAWTKINIKVMTDKNDKTIAKLITEGCDMGTRTLYGFINEYKQADKQVRDIAETIINIEEKLRDDLRRFL